MSNRYFLDTSFIIAYAIATDNQHSKTEHLEDIILNNPCYINNSILNECITVSYNKTKDMEISQEVYYIITDNFKILNEYNIVNYIAKTMNLYKKHEGKLNFTDVGIITTMKDNNILNLLTFDREFKKEKSINVIDK